MFCWPTRRGSSSGGGSSRKKSKSSDFSLSGSGSGGDDTNSPGGSTGILFKSSHKNRKKGKKSTSSNSATFKCDLSEALLPPSDECLISLRSASCNSSIRDFNQRNNHNHNQRFVSSQNFLTHFPEGVETEEDNNNRRNNKNNQNQNQSAEVLLFYSNNSLSTRNSVVDFIENEEFNYKSLWGKDINEWDSRETDSRSNTLDREGSNYIKLRPKTSPKRERLSPAKSSPALTITTSTSATKRILNDKNNEDDEPLPSPPPTPPEAKLANSVNRTFKYPEQSLEESKPFRIHSSTSTSSLSSSCILTPSPELTEEKKSVLECSTQTLPFWQLDLDFPGILHCTCNSTGDSGILLVTSSSSSSESPISPSLPLPLPLPLPPQRGNESPDSSSGISSSDDNLESLHLHPSEDPEEEIMLKSLKNSFLQQAIPFQLCNFGRDNNNGARENSGSGSGGGCRCKNPKDKINHNCNPPGGTNKVITSVTNANNFKQNRNNNLITSQEGQQIINGLAPVSDTNIEKCEKQLKLELENVKVHEQNLKNSQVQFTKKKDQKGKGACEDKIATVASQEDRNRLGPVGKNNYGSGGLDANANESDTSHHLRNGQATNGELEHTGKAPRTNDPSNIINSKTKSGNNRVSSANQQNLQNSVLLQENSSLKEEVGRLTSVVADLQEQISRLTASGEESKRTLEGCLHKADTSIAALTIVAQQFEKERQGVYDQLVQQQAENKVWKERLDEKLADLQKLREEYEKEREVHQVELRTLQDNHEIEVDVTVRNCENKLEQMQKSHDETLAELKRSHIEELERLQETQQKELELAKQKHKELLDQHRNQSPHDILHKEVESLQVVVEMRTEEIRELRKDLMDYKNTLNDLQMAREHGKTLMAKIEDLQAQLEKARSDKRSLQEKYQNLEATLHQIESENNRLVRCNEELTWKMKSYNLVEN